MNIFVISCPTEKRGVQDAYQSAVVVASSSESARMIYPGNGDEYLHRWSGTAWVWVETGRATDSWYPPSDVIVELVGTAFTPIPEGRVLAADYLPLC